MADKTAGTQTRNTPFDQITAEPTATINNTRPRVLIIGKARLAPGINEFPSHQLEGAALCFDHLLNSGAISVGTRISSSTPETNAAKIDRIRNTFNMGELKLMEATASGPVLKAVRDQITALNATTKAHA